LLPLKKQTEHFEKKEKIDAAFWNNPDHCDHLYFPWCKDRTAAERLRR
jgi:hypothetical protein